MKGTAALESRVAAALGSRAVAFERNDGQFDRRFDYVSRGVGQGIYLHSAGAEVLVPAEDGTSVQIGMKLLGSRIVAKPEASEPRAVSNFYRGNDSTQWRTGVPTFGRVRYSGVYEGIDIEYYSARGTEIEYDFVVKPGSDVSAIRFRFEGAQAARIDVDGSLVLDTPGGEVRHRAPIAYQRNTELANVRVASKFTLRDGVVGFEVGEYDRLRTLVIDPTVTHTYRVPAEWSDDDNYGVFIRSVAADAAGNVYAVGRQEDANLLSLNGIPGSRPRTWAHQAFVIKFSPSGSVIYSTYLGGTGVYDSEAYNIVTDAAGNAYVVGNTSALDFPTSNNAFQRFKVTGAYDTFLIKLGPGGSLVYSTLLGGDANENATYGLDVDSSGQAIVAGGTFGQFPGTVDTRSNDSSPSAQAHAFVTKFSADGSSIVFSTLIGGNNDNTGALGVTVDGDNNTWVSGGTAERSLPTTPDAYQPTCTLLAGPGTTCQDAFIAKLSATGTITYLTYLGGKGTDAAWDVDVDSSGRLYIGGYTESTDFPVTPNAVQAANPFGNGTASGFYTRLNPATKAIEYSTYLGAGFGVRQVHLDAMNRVVLYAHGGKYFPRLNDFQHRFSCGGNNFLVGFGLADQLEYSACFEGSFAPYIGFDGTGNYYLSDDNTTIRKVDPRFHARIVPTFTMPAGTTTDLLKSFAFKLADGDLVPPLQVRLGGNAVGSYIRDSSGKYGIVSTETLATPGLYDVHITNGDGATATLPNGFELLAGPYAVSDIQPLLLDSSQEVMLTVIGNGFVTGTTVILVDRSDSDSGYTVATYRLDARTLKATLPAMIPGTYDIYVQSPYTTQLGNAKTIKYPNPLVVQKPSILFIIPNQAPSSGGTEVNIYFNSGLVPTAVSIGGAPAVITESGPNTNRVEVTAPPHVPGQVDVTVTLPTGPITMQNGFIYYQAITATSVSPGSGSAFTGGTAVTITGTGFLPGARVVFGGMLATNVVVVNANTITALTPKHAFVNRTVPVSVFNQDGGFATIDNAFLYVGLSASAPNPNFGPAAGGTSVTINGANFDGTTQVVFGGVAGTVTSRTATQLVVTTPPHDPTFVDVVVSNASGEAVTLRRAFVFRGTPPTVSNISPNTGFQSGGTSIVITGTGFLNGAIATIGGAQIFNPVVTSTSISGTTPPGSASGSVEVKVTNPDGQFATTTFLYTPSPMIEEIDPVAGPDTGGTVVTVTGQNFENASVVSFDGTAAATLYISATTLQATTPAHAPGDVNVQVTNPDSQVATLTNGFRYLPPPPTVTSFTPASALVGATVTITGTNFMFVTSVKFNNAVASYTVDSPTQITATVPGNATTGPIKVTTQSGFGVSATNFVVDTNGPRVDSFTPTGGLAGTLVTITGVRFTGATAVRFAGITAAFSVNSDTQITASVPNNPLTGPISVQSPTGTGTSGQNFFTAPRFAATPFAPPNGSPGSTVNIQGVNFQGTTAVSFNGAAASAFSVDETGQIITATVPPAATTGFVTVTNAIGSATSTVKFYMQPTLSSVAPLSGGYGANVVITGTGFSGTTSVAFNGALASFSVADDSTINASVPNNATNGTITVTTPGGSVTSADSFTVLPSPLIAGFTPSKGTGGTVITITGQNFEGATGVTLNGLSMPFTATDATTITATVPAQATNGRIAVTTPIGTGISQTLFFLPPVLSSFAPNAGTVGSSVTITGNNFLGATGVSFAGTAAAFIVNAQNKITATVPAGAATGTLTVVTPYGPVSSSFHYTVLMPSTPTVTATATSPTSVTINWAGDPGHTYEVRRIRKKTDNFTAGALIRLSGNSYVDNTAEAGKTYLYNILDVTTGLIGNHDFATTIPFTDPALVTGVAVKRIHMTELRAAVNAMRDAAALAPRTWTDAVPTAIRALHFNELRSALAEAYFSLSRGVNFTDSPVPVGMVIRTSHVTELREAVQ